MAKITFFGTSNFSAKILRVLVSQHQIGLVITQTDKPVGRKAQITPSPVSEVAEELGLSVFKPLSLKTPEAMEAIKYSQPELFVVVAYGKIIPKNILEIPSKGPLNIHGSLLPEYRGASPIHAAIRDGKSETGITIMLMDELMDHGPILTQRAIDIQPDELFNEVENKLCKLASDLIIETIPGYIVGSILPKDQNHSEATFTKIISKESGKIDWNNSALSIYNQYRAYQNWPGVWTTWNDKIFKVNQCQIAQDVEGVMDLKTPGTVIEDKGHIMVVCGEGCLILNEVQLEGKQKTAIADFVRGHKDFVGLKLG